MERRWIPGALICALALTCAAATASAQDAEPSTEPETGPEPDVREAQMRFELGRRYYESGRFLDAATEFEAAIEVTPLPALYFNLFLAYRDAGEDARSVGPLRLYVETLEPGPRRTQLEARLRVIEARIAGEPIPEPPRATGRRRRTPPPAEERSVDPAPWILVGTGGLLVVGAVVTGLLALGERSTLDELCAAPDRCPEGFEDPRSRGEALAITTDVLWIGGAAVLASGVLWAIVDATSNDSSPRAGLACDGNGCVASLRGEL
ncbi:MAG: hypothetical protein H6719_07285 [Sandaracinaceae bacterium]|nr:hypothetical protein [Sandaracinaceae bacterium]